MFHRYFPTYEVEEPESNAMRSLDGGSYVVAGLLGCFYVLIKGFVGRFFLALAIDLVGIAGAGFAILVLANYLGGIDAYFAMLIVILGLAVVRSVPMIAIVKNGYRRRGWTVMRV
jgi:hypothetical protein